MFLLFQEQKPLLKSISQNIEQRLDDLKRVDVLPGG